MWSSMLSDVITIERTSDNFRLIYDVKGRFTVHRISVEEAKVRPSVRCCCIREKRHRPKFAIVFPSPCVKPGRGGWTWKIARVIQRLESSLSGIPVHDGFMLTVTCTFQTMMSFLIVGMEKEGLYSAFLWIFAVQTVQGAQDIHWTQECSVPGNSWWSYHQVSWPPGQGQWHSPAGHCNRKDQGLHQVWFWSVI